MSYRPFREHIERFIDLPITLAFKKLLHPKLSGNFNPSHLRRGEPELERGDPCSSGTAMSHGDVVPSARSSPRNDAHLGEAHVEDSP